jgi:hypothetical protein
MCPRWSSRVTNFLICSLDADISLRDERYDKHIYDAEVSLCDHLCHRTLDADISCDQLSDGHVWHCDIGHLFRPWFWSPSVQGQIRPGHCACIVLINICSYFSLGNRDPTLLHCTSMRLETKNQLNNNNTMEPMHEGDTIPRLSTIQVYRQLSLKKKKKKAVQRFIPKGSAKSSRASYQGKPGQWQYLCRVY